MVAPSAPSPVPPPRVLPYEAEAVTVAGGRADAGVIVICDHASNALPEPYGTLGLPSSELERHIGYDIGAAAVTLKIAAMLEAPAVLSRFSRLLIDPNRGQDDPTLIMRISDGAVVPGNRLLDAKERVHRLERFYLPYHEAVGAAIDAALMAGVAPIVLSIHSFTPIMKGIARPWQVGVLWDKDPRLAHELLQRLGADPALVVGDNEPYNGSLMGDTLYRHGTRRGLAHAIVEVRQDLIGDETGQAAWAERIVAIMRDLLADPIQRARLLAVDFHGSHADVPGPHNEDRS